jgi:hypothetical protein
MELKKEQLKHIDNNKWVEIVHPDHNCWYSPYTLKNTVTKFLKSYKGRIQGIQDLFETFDKPHLIEILNTMADNSKVRGKGYAKDGGQIIKDNNGYWNPQNWGKTVEISSPQISMKNVSQTLLGVADTGERKIMKTDNEYNFTGASKVTEIPLTKAEENFLKDLYS